jgi:predicted kinase
MIAYITVGLPASGKTTWAKEFVENQNQNKSDNDPTRMDRINNDDIRKAIYEFEMQGNQTWTPKIESRVREIREALISAHADLRSDVVLDNTHLNPKTLKQITDFCESKGYEIKIVDFCHVPLEECIRRDSLRNTNQKVGEKVIMNMYNAFLKKTPAHDQNLPEWIPNNLPDCIIVDIDGTLAKMKDRGPYDEHKVYQDDIRKHVLLTIASIMQANPELKVFIFSGRSDACLSETVRWLNDKCCFFVENHNKDKDSEFFLVDNSVELHMRKTGDRRRDSFVKTDMYNEFVKDKYNVIVVFDDRPQVIRECWKVLNLPVFNCGVIDVEF